ncbi:hypothetical protein AMECASPLE_008065 [Ameca splendens]|uniref:Uncharacterized protein n=1 Tax=Ameca splendens TaxID=208324 RepID=A0ABV0YXR1_9TELE
MRIFVAISRLSHRTAQRRRISGETRARRRTFAPQGHSRKSLKAGDLSDRRRSGDLFTLSTCLECCMSAVFRSYRGDCSIPANFSAGSCR